MLVARSLLILIFASLVMTASLVTGPADFAHAQENDPAALQGAVPGGTTEAGSSDAELWRQIRQGNQGTVAGANPRSGLMIQSEGERWRQIRNSELPMYSAIAILGMLILLSIFFAIRGRIRIEHGQSGHTITRFNLLERASHWLLASSFIVLALTGLNLIFGRSLVLPWLGAEAFAFITVTGKYIHNYVGFAFMVALVLVAFLWVIHNIPNRHDVVWLLKGGGMLGGGHPPAKKFNAGQKIIFWVVILCGISISMSGWALLNPFTTTMMADTAQLSNSILGTSFPTEFAAVQEQQLQSIWHSAMAVFMIVVIIAHIYLGTVGMEGALDAMTSGEVDENWAREHHSIWVDEVNADNKDVAAGKPQPAE
jgi:formate dehydrogenase subunit gamma